MFPKPSRCVIMDHHSTETDSSLPEVYNVAQFRRYSLNLQYVKSNSTATLKELKLILRGFDFSTSDKQPTYVQNKINPVPCGTADQCLKLHENSCDYRQMCQVSTCFNKKISTEEFLIISTIHWSSLTYTHYFTFCTLKPGEELMIHLTE